MSERQCTLVTIFLRGGADGMHMVVPYGDPDYASLRPSLAIAAPGEAGADSCLDLDGFYGLHPALAPLYPAFRDRRLAIVHAAGSDDDSRSHFEAQDQMERGARYGQRLGGGWVGRYLRARAERAGDTAVPAIAIGKRLPEALRGAPSAAAMTRLAELELRGVDAKRGQLMASLEGLYGSEGALGAAGRDTLSVARRVTDLTRSPATDTSYPEGELGSGLRDVARLIDANVGLRVACLELGGWDTHFFQGGVSGAMAERMRELATALIAFDQDMAARGTDAIVTVMTEFGRRAYENASLGTDHGRASVMWVLGEGLRGGEVHGRWPGLKPQQRDGPGDLTVTTDYRAVLSEVLSCCGGVASERVFTDYTPTPVGLLLG